MKDRIMMMQINFNLNFKEAGCRMAVKGPKTKLLYIGVKHISYRNIAMKCGLAYDRRTI